MKYPDPKVGDTAYKWCALCKRADPLKGERRRVIHQLEEKVRKEAFEQGRAQALEEVEKIVKNWSMDGQFFTKGVLDDLRTLITNLKKK